MVYQPYRSKPSKDKSLRNQIADSRDRASRSNLWHNSLNYFQSWAKRLRRFWGRPTKKQKRDE